MGTKMKVWSNLHEDNKADLLVDESNKNIDVIDKLKVFKEKYNISINSLSKILNLPRTSINRLLEKDLQKLDIIT